MKLNTLRDLYVEELRDIYSAEKQILAALPKMIDGAELPELKAAFEEHLTLTEGHVNRLETIFDGLDLSPKGKKCKGMEGLLEEGSELLDENDGGSVVLDAGLIGAAQRVEHYEMAAYGTARAHAHELGLDDDADLLQQTLDEEEAADLRLTEIAEQSANIRADAGQATPVRRVAANQPARGNGRPAAARDDDEFEDENEDLQMEESSAVPRARPAARSSAASKGGSKSSTTKRANGNRTSAPMAAKRK